MPMLETRELNIYAGTPAKILAVRNHTAHERSFELDKEVTGRPGQFVIVSLPMAGEVPVSISGFKPHSIEITLRNAGTVTSQIFKLKAGDMLYVRGPYGNGFPLESFEKQHLLVIAGGSALAPAKPILEHCMNGGGLRVSELDLLAGFKSPKHILFHKELDRWRKACNVVVTVDHDEDYAWMGGIGFVVDFIKHIRHIGSDTKVVIIGPPPMITNSVRELIQYGVQESNIWISLERHMKCGVGKCGHCRIRAEYVCLDGPVFNYVKAKRLID